MSTNKKRIRSSAMKEADRLRQQIRRKNPLIREIERHRDAMRHRERRANPLVRMAECSANVERKRLRRSDPAYRLHEQTGNTVQKREPRHDFDRRLPERIADAQRKRIKRADPEYRAREQQRDRVRKQMRRTSVNIAHFLDISKCTGNSNGTPPIEVRQNIESCTQSNTNTVVNCHEPAKLQLTCSGYENSYELPTNISSLEINQHYN